jgi:hypothetical protein
VALAGKVPKGVEERVAPLVRRAPNEGGPQSIPCAPFE